MMKTSLRLPMAIALLLAALPAAHAQADATTTRSADDMCFQAANFPKPYGEWDLKGHAKLPAYCACFNAAFKVRAEKAAKYMQAHPGKAPPGTAEEVAAQELAMRNTCRKQLGLPVAVDPNK